MIFKLGQLKLGGRGVERRLIGPRIDDEQQVALLDVLIVDDRQFRNRPAHMRRDSDRVGANVSVVGAWIYIVEARDVETDDDSSYYDRGAQHVAGKSQGHRCFAGLGSSRHSSVLRFD